MDMENEIRLRDWVGLKKNKNKTCYVKAQCLMLISFLNFGIILF